MNIFNSFICITWVIQGSEFHFQFLKVIPLFTRVVWKILTVPCCLCLCLLRNIFKISCFEAKVTNNGLLWFRKVFPILDILTIRILSCTIFWIALCQLKVMFFALLIKFLHFFLHPHSARLCSQPCAPVLISLKWCPSPIPLGVMRVCFQLHLIFSLFSEYLLQSSSYPP